MVAKALKVADKMKEQNIYCSVYDMHTIKPLDKDAVKKCLNSKLIVTIEEHSIIGGLGSAVSEELAQYKNKPSLLPFGITDSFAHAAEYNYLLQSYGLDEESLFNSIKQKYTEV